MQTTPPPAADTAAPSPARRYSPLWLVVGLSLAGWTVWTLSLPSQRPNSVHPPRARPPAASEPAHTARPRGERRIAGQVLDERGAPVPAAAVRLSLLDDAAAPAWNTSANSAGEFSVDGLPAEPLRVEVAAPGHENIERVLPAAESAPLVISLARQGELDVQVLGCAGGSADARAYLSGGGLFPALERALDGTFETVFTGLPAGAYIVHARCGTKSVRNHDALPVVPGARALAALSVSDAPSLEVHVVDAQESRPLAGAVVEVSDASPGMPALRSKTDTAGIAHILALWPGALALEVSHAEYVGARLELTIEAGHAVREIRLDGAAHLHGHVLDERGLPIAAATLSLASAAGEPVALRPLEQAAVQGVGELGVTVGPVPDIPVTAGNHGVLGTWAGSTDGEGAFDLAGLTPGNLTLRASHLGYAPTSFALTALAAHESREITLILRASGALAGVLRDPAGQPVAGVYVSARAADGVDMSALSDDRGAYRFDDVLGPFTVEAALDGATALSCSATVLPGAEAECNFETAALGPARTVRVVDAAGFAIAGALVSAVAADGRELASAISQRNGDATLRHVPDGPYLVRAVAPGLASAEQEAEPDDGAGPLRLVLGKAGGITGIVLDVTGRGVPNARIAATDNAASSVSQGDGSFRLDGLATGVTVLEAQHDSAGAGSSAPLRVRAGESLPGARIVLSGRYLADSVDSSRAAPRHNTPHSSQAVPHSPEAAPRSAHVAPRNSDDATLVLRGNQLIVTSVRPNSALARAGLQAGDALLSVDGERALSAAQALGMLRDPAGKSAAVRLMRSGRPLQVRVVRSSAHHLAR